MTRDEINKANNQFRKERIEEEREIRKELHDELAALRASMDGQKKALDMVIEENKALRAQVEVLQGAYDTAKDRSKALSAENERLKAIEKQHIEFVFSATRTADRMSAQIEVLQGAYDAANVLRAENAQIKADNVKMYGALQRCKKWFFQKEPLAVLPGGTGQEAHREITDVLFRAEIPA